MSSVAGMRRPWHNRSRALIREVEDYFLRNPDEVLTQVDMQTKFEASPANVKDTIWKLTQGGFLRAFEQAGQVAKLYGRSSA